MGLGLAVPVVLSALSPLYFFHRKSLKHRFLNIDAPIAAIIVCCFITIGSAWEVISASVAVWLSRFHDRHWSSLSLPRGSCIPAKTLNLPAASGWQLRTTIPLIGAARNGRWENEQQPGDLPRNPDGGIPC